MTKTILSILAVVAVVAMFGSSFAPALAASENSAEVDKESNRCIFLVSFTEKDGRTVVRGATTDVQIVTTKSGNENITCKFSTDDGTLRILRGDIDKAHHVSVRTTIIDFDDGNAKRTTCDVTITPSGNASLTCHLKR